MFKLSMLLKKKQTNKQLTTISMVYSRPKTDVKMFIKLCSEKLARG